MNPMHLFWIVPAAMAYGLFLGWLLRQIERDDWK